MAINYPLIMPSSPGFSRLVFRGVNTVGMSASPFTGQQQTYLYPGEWWTAGVTLPPMTRAQAELWLAFLLALRGKSGTFLLGDRGGKIPQGPGGAANPYALTDQQTGTILTTWSWDVVSSTRLKAGDYIQLCKNYIIACADFSNTSWVKTNCSYSGGYLVPSGSATVTQLIAPSAKASKTFSFMCWIKTQTGTSDVTVSIIDQASNVIATATQTVNSSSSYFMVSGPALPTATAITLRIQFTASIALLNSSAYSPDGGEIRLHKALTDVVTNGSAIADIDIWPRLREPVAVNSALVLSNTKGIFRLADNTIEWDLDTAMNYGLGFSAMEAF